MAFYRHAIPMFITGPLAAQPCSAADDHQQFTSGERRTSAFLGLSIRLPMGRSDSFSPSARLQFTSEARVRDWRTGSVEMFKPRGVELGVNRAGAVSMFVHGLDVSDVQKASLGDSSRETTYSIIGALVVSVAVIAFLASNAPASPGG